MHNKSNTKYFQVAQGFVGRRETGVGYTISQFLESRFLVFTDFCYRIFLKRIFCGFGLFEAGVGICAFCET